MCPSRHHGTRRVTLSPCEALTTHESEGHTQREAEGDRSYVTGTRAGESKGQLVPGDAHALSRSSSRPQTEKADGAAHGHSLRVNIPT